MFPVEVIIIIEKLTFVNCDSRVKTPLYRRVSHKRVSAILFQELMYGLEWHNWLSKMLLNIQENPGNYRESEMPYWQITSYVSIIYNNWSCTHNDDKSAWMSVFKSQLMLALVEKGGNIIPKLHIIVKVTIYMVCYYDIIINFTIAKTATTAC